MTTSKSWATAMLAMACGAAPVALWAHPPGHEGRPRTPPAEAYAACAEAAAGDACEVEIHDRTIRGVCVARGEEERLHCQPDRPPPPPREPPPEAYAACAQAAAGDACEVEIHERTIHGVCVARADEERLHCRPDRPPPPPPPPPPAE